MIKKVIFLLCIALPTIALCEQTYLDEYRQMSRVVPFGEKLVYCLEKHRELSPVDRSRVLAVLWERLPETIEISDYSDIVDLTNATFVITSAYCGDGEMERLKGAGFFVCHKNEEAVLLSREKPDKRQILRTVQAIKPTWFPREIVALCVFASIFIGIWWGVMVKNGECFSPMAVVIAIGMLVLYSATTLGHTFLAPNGLGVYGGKAKWLYSASLDFSPFLSNRAFELMQIGYPPGLTVLTYIYYLISGGCGDWLVQLLTVVPLTLTYLTLEAGNRSWLFRAFLLSIFISPVAIMLVHGYYAEPFAFLCIAMGVRNYLKKGRSWWVFLGVAALFRFECLLALAVFYLWNSKRFSVRETCLLVRALFIGTLWIICVFISPFTIVDVGSGGVDWHRLSHFKVALFELINHYWMALFIIIAILFRRIRDHIYVVQTTAGLVLWVCFFGAVFIVDGSGFLLWKICNLMPRLLFLWFVLFAAQNEEAHSV